MTTAVVVGSGPNGLAAAVTLAASGVDVTVLEAADVIGGGTRSSEATLPGLVHDECSGFHPLSMDTAFTRAFDLTAHGLGWATPDIQYAHPLTNGDGAAVWQSVEQTARRLGADGVPYQRMFGPLAERFGYIADEFMQPMIHLPRHPVALTRFGSYAVMPAVSLARRWRFDSARALFAGVAAHAFYPLTAPLSSAIGIALGAAAHNRGWPVAIGGSAAITTAMAGLLDTHGGRIETGITVRDYRDLDNPDVLILDTSPSAAAGILDGVIPRRVRRAYRKFRHGPAAFHVAFAVDGGIPWTHPESRRAGTVHVGGTIDEIAYAEKQVWRGQLPERPFVLVGQQSIADPSRARNDVHPVDVYAHVPAGWQGDATQHIIDQIERFAPGFTERIVHKRVRSTVDIQADNPNFVGGDILTGANSPRQLIFRPRIALNPYATGVPGVFLCSAATPPGAGAHGMGGFNAAQSALKHLAESGG